ncbi:oligoendopeptidase F [Capsulimonas corticalis]|uniref:Oligoendopeptidase F n=1 Tax=Capsulimonas corticalis TaxID=2219043 RepID=A0A402CXY0_9BACT|nr:M3 family oligoendopeptidase [Capsulimonas corticalis]BDI32165.1 oligoendopeptidase F [Capsulimonas corticalis]
MTDLETTTDVRWDLSDLYDSIDDPRIEAVFTALQTRSEAFQAKYKGKIDSADLTAATLGEALREYEAIDVEATKPAAYASLLFSTDTSNAAYGAFMQKMREKGTALSLPTMFFSLELAAAPDDVVTPLLSTPEVSPYKHFVLDTRLHREHMLSETEERLLEETANTGARAWDRLFDEITANAVFKLDGEEMTQPQVLSKLYVADRETRRKAAAAFTEGLQANSRSTGFIFNTLMQDKNVRDRLRKYTYPEQSRHLANELSKETVDLVVDTVYRNYPVVARYYHVKREILGLDTLTHYDRYAPLFQADETLSFEEAHRLILDAFGEFSPIMRERAAEFFDKNWIDAAPAKGKQGGAYCSSVTPDLHPYVFMNYLGKMKDVMTLAHELGHGVHGSLARAQTLLNFYGTLPLAELASTFGEMLVFDKVVAQASIKDKLALYAEKIEGTFATIPRQTAMYRFEKAIHNHRRTQGELTLEDFGNYWHTEIQAMFGDSITMGDEHRLWWSYIGHFTGSPFYVYAYSFGELLALALYRKSQTEGAAFAAKYLDMLSAGGSLTPQDLVAKVGVNLDDPDFWQGGFEVLGGMVARFEELWAEYQAA